ncbi:MAG: hypothetical protein MHM6MM_000921 [Cercozoa sp. M6MM]
MLVSRLQQRWCLQARALAATPKYTVKNDIDTVFSGVDQHPQESAYWNQPRFNSVIGANGLMPYTGGFWHIGREIKDPKFIHQDDFSVAPSVRTSHIPFEIKTELANRKKERSLKQRFWAVLARHGDTDAKRLAESKGVAAASGAADYAKGQAKFVRGNRSWPMGLYLMYGRDLDALAVRLDAAMKDSEYWRHLMVWGVIGAALAAVLKVAMDKQHAPHASEVAKETGLSMDDLHARVDFTAPYKAARFLVSSQLDRGTVVECNSFIFTDKGEELKFQVEDVMQDLAKAYAAGDAALVEEKQAEYKRLSELLAKEKYDLTFKSFAFRLLETLVYPARWFLHNNGLFGWTKHADHHPIAHAMHHHGDHVSPMLSHLQHH